MLFILAQVDEVHRDDFLSVLTGAGSHRRQCFARSGSVLTSLLLGAQRRVALKMAGIAQAFS